MLAEANQLSIRRLLSKATADSTVTPGPPLPNSHPSPSLLGKLSVEVHTIFKTAQDLLAGLSKSRELATDISPDLTRYIQSSVSISAASSYLWLGVDAGESDRTGEAVAWLQLALSTLEQGSKAKGLAKIAELRKGASQAAGSHALETSINSFLKAYKKMNDTVRLLFLSSRLLTL